MCLLYFWRQYLTINYFMHEQNSFIYIYRVGLEALSSTFYYIALASTLSRIIIIFTWLQKFSPHITFCFFFLATTANYPKRIFGCCVSASDNFQFQLILNCATDHIFCLTISAAFLWTTKTSFDFDFRAGNFIIKIYIYIVIYYIWWQTGK